MDLASFLLFRRCRSNFVGLVRLDAIGDFVLWLPSAQALVTELRAQNKHVILIANHIWASWAKVLLDVDKVVEVDTNRMGEDLSYRIKVMFQVRGLMLGTIICPTYSRVPGDGNDALVFGSGASVRIASAGYQSSQRIASWLRSVINLGYSNLIPAADRHMNGKLKSEPEINESFMKGLGIRVPHLIAKLPHRQDDSSSELYRPSGKYVVVIPGAGWSGRAWPVTRYAEVAKKINNMGYKIVVSGSASEKSLCDSLAATCNGINLAGKTTLQELANVIRFARLVIGNDSSGIHIAVASGVDSICVKWGGGGHFGRFIPYAQSLLPEGLRANAVYHLMDCFGCNGDCSFPLVNGKVQCIESISVDQVISAVCDILSLDVVDRNTVVGHFDSDIKH